MIKKTPSELSLAAQALDEELATYEQAVHEARKIVLDSRQNLERAAKALEAVLQSDERLRGLVGELLATINRAAQRQQGQAEALQQRALEVQARTSVLERLLTEYGNLGNLAQEASTRMKELAAGDQGALPLAEVKARVSAIADHAQELAGKARDDGFGDIARQADALRQQILSALNKLSLLTDRLN
jgi:hypothetical protein